MIDAQAIEAARRIVSSEDSPSPGYEGQMVARVARALLSAKETMHLYWTKWGQAVSNETRFAKEKARWMKRAEAAEAELAALRQAVRDAQDGIEAIVAHDYVFHTIEGALAAVAQDLREKTALHMGGN